MGRFDQTGLVYEAAAALPGVPVRRWHDSLPRGRWRGRGPDVALLEGPAGLFAVAGLRAAGDDAGARIDGSLVAEYARERRLYIPIQAVPKLVINAFISAEDKNFYEHGGLDFGGIVRAGMLYAQNYGSSRRPQGASTITQQVAKNFLLTNEVSFQRKIKEALLALQDRAHLFQGKDPRTLSQRNLSGFQRLWRCRRVASLFRQVGARTDRRRERPISRRCPRHRRCCIRSASAIARSSGATTSSTAWSRTATSPRPTAKRQEEPAQRNAAANRRARSSRRNISPRKCGARSTTSMAEKKLYEGRAFGAHDARPEDPGDRAQGTDRRGRHLDEQQGYRGPVAKIDIAGDWGLKLADVRALNDISPWRLAVVLEVNDQGARIGFQPAREPGGAVVARTQDRQHRARRVKWAKPAAGPDGSSR